jgi:hypothetical protein
MALAGFFGAAAQSTDDSMREWRRLFQVDLAREQQQKQFEDNLDFMKTDATAQRNFTAEENEADRVARWAEFEQSNQTQIYLARLQRDLTQGIADQNEAYQLGEYFLNNFDSMSPDMQDNIATWLQESGNVFGRGAQAMIRTSLYQNPNDALGYLDNLLAGTGPERYDIFRVTEAARAAGSLAGMTGSDLEDYIQGYTDLANARNSDAEEFDVETMNQLRISTNQARADLAYREASTEQVHASIADTIEITRGRMQEYGIREEESVTQLAILEENLQGLRLSNQRGEIELEYLPDALEAEVGEAFARIREYDNSNEMFRATFDAVVETAMQELDITRAEATVATATTAYRIAISQGESEQVGAITARINAETENINARTDLTETEKDALIQEISLARVDAAQRLVQTGNPELIGALGGDLLSPLLGDKAPGVVEGLVEIAESDRTNDQKIIDANLLMSTAERELKVEQAALVRKDVETYDERMQFDQSVQQARVDVSRGELAVSQGHLQLARDRLALDRDLYNLRLTESTEGGGPDTVAPLDLLNDIRLATGTSTNDIITWTGDIAQLENDIMAISDMVNNPETTNQDLIATVMSRWGLDYTDTVMGLAVPPDTIVRDLERMVTSRSTSLVAATAQQLEWGMGNNTLFTPQQLGVPEHIWERAMMINGYMGDDPMFEGMDSDEAASIQGIIETAITSFPGFTPAEFSARPVFDLLIDQGHQEALAAAGITTPSELAPYVRVKQEQLDINTEAWNAFSSLASNQFRYPGNVDFTDARARNEMLNWAVLTDNVLGQYSQQWEEVRGAPTQPSSVIQANQENLHAIAQVMGFNSGDMVTDLTQFNAWAINNYDTPLFGAQTANNPTVWPSQVNKMLTMVQDQLREGREAAQTLSNWR